jgi:HK97 family phage major capsid protein
MPENQTFTREQLTGLISEIIKGQLSEVHKQIAEAQAADRAKYVKDLLEANAAVHSRGVVPAEEKGIRAARFIRCIRQAQLKGGNPADYARKLGDEVVAKALGEGNLGTGGALIPQTFSAEIIELLRAQAVIRSMQPRFQRLVNGNASTPYIATGSSAAYVGENQPAAASDPTTGMLQLTAKKLVSLVPSSNEELRDGGPEVDAVIRDDMVSALRVREDLAFIRGNGANSTPRGMRFWAVVANVLTETNVAGVVNGATAVEIAQDLGRMVRRLLDGNIQLLRPGWVMSPRVWSRLYNQQDANSNYIWQAEMKEGKLMGFPFKLTTQIPGNLAAPLANSTELYLAEFSTLVIADAMDIEVESFAGGTYVDAGGNLVSGISNDQTVFRAIARHDFGARQRGSEVVVLQCSWGTV